jgi:hypothetical protein
MRHARNNRWTSSKSSCLAEPVTPSSMTKEQAQVTSTKDTILLALQKYRGCLLFDALAWPQQLQVESKVQK